MAMDGVLPVNNNGNGIGQLSFDISLKRNLPDGTEIPNKATIVFDANEPIETPTWVNTISMADIQMGDVNDDGEIDIADAVCVVNFVVGKPVPTFNTNAADVNGDGDIDIADAVHIVNIVVGRIKVLSPKMELNLLDPQ